MGTFSIWHWIIIGVVVLVVFGGKGKISDIMGDFAKGIKSFKKGLADDDDKGADKPSDKTIDHTPGAPVARTEQSEESRKVG